MTGLPPSKDEKTWFRYMPVSRNVKPWGAHVKNVGFAVVPPFVDCHPYNHYHPADHQVVWERGRMLSSYTFVYITRGAGVFDSKHSGSRPVRPGDVIVLFPHVWHRYQPLADTGWDEYWMEFDGEYIRHLMSREEFSPEHPVQQIGVRDEILDLF